MMVEGMLPIGMLFKVVFESIIEVFLICMAGYILARQGIFDKRTQKQVNKLNVSFFTPALLFAKVAFFLTPSKLGHLWVVPVFFFLASGVSMLVAYLLGLLFRLKRTQRNFAASAAMFMNSTSLPVSLMQSLVGTVKSLRRDSDDNEDDMLSRALTFIMLFSCLGMILRWSVGVQLLTPKDDENSQSQGQGTQRRDSREDQDRPRSSRGRSHEPREGILVDVEPANPQGDIPISASQNGMDGVMKMNKKPKFHHLPTFFHIAHTPQRSPVRDPSPSDDSASEYEIEEGPNHDEALLIPIERQQKSRSSRAKASSKRAFRRLWRRTRKILKAVNEFMSAPLWAAFLSLVVAMIPPLQHLLNTKLNFIKSAATMSGNCAVPLTLAILGAYFHQDDDDSSPGKDSGSDAQNQRDTNNDESQRGIRFFFTEKLHGVLDQLRSKYRESTPPGETTTMIIAVLTRMVLAPLLIIPLLALGAHFDTPKIFDDPVLMVSLVLLVTGPPALMLVQITQQVSGEIYERLISRTVFWSYCVVTPPATIIYVVIGLLLVKL